MNVAFGERYELQPGESVAFPEGLTLEWVKRDIHRFEVGGVPRTRQDDLYQVSQEGAQRDLVYSWGFPGGDVEPSIFSLDQKRFYRLDFQARILTRIS